MKRYNVTLVNGDEFTEDSFQAAARRVSEMVRRISPCLHAELSSGETDVGRWFADARTNGVGNREWTGCSSCRVDGVALLVVTRTQAGCLIRTGEGVAVGIHLGISVGIP